MLKIKDNVDLKELEKFGFEEMEKSWGIYTYIKNDGFDAISDLKTKSIIDVYLSDRSINIYKVIKCDKYHYTTRDVKGIEILFDLISAGLVEKVGE